jgi:frataxin-like iron-binding protein CyaY
VINVIFETLENIKKELDKLEITSYDLQITFKDKTNISFSKVENAEKKTIGF